MDIKSHADIIELWPTQNEFAAAVGLHYNLTRKWFKRNRIPPEYWVDVVNACHEIDAPVTFKLLAELMLIHKKTPSGKG